MSLRPTYPKRALYIVVLIPLLTLAYIFTGVEQFMMIASTLFWASLLVFFWRPVKVENGKIVLEWGWPLVFFRKEIPFEEIREIIDPASTGRIRLIRYFKEVYFLVILWVVVGLVGLLKNAPYGPFMWVMWIYWGLVTFFQYLYTYRERWLACLSIISLSLVVGFYLYDMGQEGVGEYVALVGFILAFLFILDLGFLRGVLLVTDDEVYMLSSWDPEDVKAFLNRLGSSVTTTSAEIGANYAGGVLNEAQ